LNQLGIFNYELRIFNYELRIFNYELGITNYELGITNYEFGFECRTFERNLVQASGLASQGLGRQVGDA